MAPANKEAASTNIVQLHIKININRKIKSIIINLDAIENSMIKKYIKNKKHLIQNKKQLYRLINLNNILLNNN